MAILRRPMLRAGAVGEVVRATTDRFRPGWARVDHRARCARPQTGQRRVLTEARTRIREPVRALDRGRISARRERDACALADAGQRSAECRESVPCSGRRQRLVRIARACQPRSRERLSRNMLCTSRDESSAVSKLVSAMSACIGTRLRRPTRPCSAALPCAWGLRNCCALREEWRAITLEVRMADLKVPLAPPYVSAACRGPRDRRIAAGARPGSCPRRCRRTQARGESAAARSFRATAA